MPWSDTSSPRFPSHTVLFLFYHVIRGTANTGNWCMFSVSLIDSLKQPIFVMNCISPRLYSRSTYSLPIIYSCLCQNSNLGRWWLGAEGFHDLSWKPGWRQAEVCMSCSDDSISVPLLQLLMSQYLADHQTTCVPFTWLEWELQPSPIKSR